MKLFCIYDTFSQKEITKYHPEIEAKKQLAYFRKRGKLNYQLKEKE